MRSVALGLLSIVTACTGAAGDSGAPVVFGTSAIEAGQRGCASGGVLIEMGLDDDPANGVLEPSERRHETVVCHGDKGETGATGATGDEGRQGDRGDKGEPGDRRVGPHGLTIEYAVGRFSITCNNAPCAPGNAGFVIMPGRTPGQLVTLEVTNEHAFTDAAVSGVSDIRGARFGTAGGAWNEARPFFLYAVNGDDTSAGLRFAIGPSPTYVASPPEDIFYAFHGEAGALDDRTLFFLTDEDPVPDLVQAPMLLIGSLRMTKSVNDDWLVEPLLASDGIGRFQTDRLYVLPSGQRGAVAGTYFFNTVAAPPAFPEQAVYYRLSLDGRCQVFAGFESSAILTVNGGAHLKLALPYEAARRSGVPQVALGSAFIQNGANQRLGIVELEDGGDARDAALVRYHEQDEGKLVTTTSVLGTGFATAGFNTAPGTSVILSLSFEYPCF